MQIYQFWGLCEMQMKCKCNANEMKCDQMQNKCIILGVFHYPCKFVCLFVAVTLGTQGLRKAGQPSSYLHPSPVAAVHSNN